MNLSIPSLKYQLLAILVLVIFQQPVMGAEDFVFKCKHTEKDFVEEYEMKLIPATKGSKAKIYLDGRDLDQSDASGMQVVKSIQISNPTIVMIVDAQFPPGNIGGVFYPAGTVTSLVTLNQTTGKLKKVETIQGGILGSNLGNGTRISEETCISAKAK